MKQLKLRIIHETNPRKYFPALFELADNNQLRIVGIHRYSVVKEWFRSWLRDRSPFIQRTRNALGDFFFRLCIPFINGETIVIGFAPWDWRLLIYRLLAKRNRIIYHTSWHDWRFEHTPRQAKLVMFQRYMQRQWINFIKHPNVTVVAVTPVVAMKFEKETGVTADIVPHAVPDFFFEANKNRSDSGVNTLKLLYVGEISEKKGVKVLLNIMAKLYEQPISLTLVGNGPLNGEVEIASNKSEKIKFLGPIYDKQVLAKTMAEHDILLLLSQKTKTWEELFGIVIIEAIAAGCGVIATNHIGPKEIFGDKNYPGLFEQNDLDGVCALLRSIQNEPTKIEELRSVQHIASDYSMYNLKKAWIKVLE